MRTIEENKVANLLLSAEVLTESDGTAASRRIKFCFGEIMIESSLVAQRHGVLTEPSIMACINQRVVNLA